MCSEKQRYTVQAFDDRFSICTKPFNAQSTYLYFVADLESGMRGPTNWPYGLPFTEELDTTVGAGKLLAMLITGEATHSSRNRPMKLTENETSQLNKR